MVKLYEFDIQTTIVSDQLNNNENDNHNILQHRKIEKQNEHNIAK